MARRLAVRALAGLAVVAACLVAAEGAARLTYAARGWLRARAHQVPSKPDLASYEMPDPAHPGSFLLRPGVTLTWRAALEEARRNGSVIGVRNLERARARHEIAEDEVILRVNAHGYKGPELDESGTRLRVLAIGDSCTFGTLVDRFTYPRVLERELTRAGLAVEVVNAGVGGYSPSHARLRLDEFRALRPDAVVIYIGWNALYGEEAQFRRGLDRLAIVRMARTAWTRLRAQDRRQAALAAYHRPKRPDPDDSEVAWVKRAYRPSFLADIEVLASTLQREGARVWLATLPGLYLPEVAPTPGAVAIGHLPEFTDNPYVIAAMTERSNEALRQLAAQLGVGLVDLDAWSRAALVPREAWFTDSVHLTEAGQERIGRYLAAELAPALGPAPEP